MRRRTRRWTRSIVMTLACGCGAAALPLAATQAQPTTAPAAAQPQQQAQRQDDDERPRERMRLGGDGRMGRGEYAPGEGRGDAGPGSAGGAERPPPFDAPTAEEWDRSDAFLKEHAPKRWAILQNLDEEGQQRVRGFVFFRFRALERLKNTDPDMYQLQLKRFGVEDEIFGIRFPIRHENRYPRHEETSKLRERVGVLVDLGVEERELRVQRLRDMLRREEEYLNSERNGREAAISERMASLADGRGLGISRRRDGEGGGYPAPPGPPSPDRRQAP